MPELQPKQRRADGAATAADDDGFVLVSVIWIVVLIGVLSSSFAITTRLNVKASANLAHAAGIQLIGDGVVRLLALETTVLNAPAASASVNGSIVECVLPSEITVRYALQDQSGLIDLNAASKHLLEHFFARISGGKQRGDALADAVLDYRDVDDQRRPAGATTRSHPPTASLGVGVKTSESTECL